MSINQTIKATLQEKKLVGSSKTGSKKYGWLTIAEIDISLYKTNSMAMTQSIKYQESTHVGITWYKGVEECDQGKYRLVIADKVYDVTSSNPTGRRTVLLLKRLTSE